MARYIDLEELERRIKKYVKPEIPEEKAFVEYYKDECIRQGYAMPTADVVPKSEVDKTIAEWAYLHADVLNKLENARSEVAREIFEEIESLLAIYTYEDNYGDYISTGLADEFAELKKKYTEEKI